jgi:hypothetical protein
MTAVTDFHKLPPLTSDAYLNIWPTYALEKKFRFVCIRGELS